MLAPTAQIGLAVAGTALVALAVLGGSALPPGAQVSSKGAVRATFWGALAMAAMAGVGMMFGSRHSSVPGAHVSRSFSAAGGGR